MNIYATDSEAAIINDSQNLATWNRERTIEELRSFVNSRHALLPDDIDIE